MHTDFSRGRSGGLVFPSLSKFSTVYCDPHSQRLWHSQYAEIDVFLEISCFLDDPADVGNLISGSSAFSNTSLNIWKFTVHALLKPGLENFKHYFTSMWDECNCVVAWAFLSLSFLGIGMKTDLFQSCGHCWVFQICWHIEFSTFTPSSFFFIYCSGFCHTLKWNSHGFTCIPHPNPPLPPPSPTRSL